MEPVHLLYVACGRADISVQALYAAYSALAYQGSLNLSIHIYTDDLAFFHPLTGHIALHEVTAETLRSWRGPGDYPFRIKIAAIADLAKNESAAKVLFADADTFFFAEMAPAYERTDKQNAVMHRKEYLISRHPTRQLQRFRDRMGKFRFRDSAVDLNSDMWNSGAIGLHASQFHLLETILAFIDTVSPHYKKQLVEQYAVSYYLQKNAQVHPCDDRLFHYWNQKAEYGKAISQRLERWRSLPLEAALQELRQNRIELPPYQPQHGWFRRLSDRILGEGRESGGV